MMHSEKTIARSLLSLLAASLSLAHASLADQRPPVSGKPVFRIETEPAFALKLSFQIGKQTGKSVLVLESRQPDGGYRLEIGGTALVLCRDLGAKSQRLAARLVAFCARNTLIVVRREALLRIALNSRILMETSKATEPTNSVLLLDPDARLRLLEEPLCQPMESPYLTDDFMAAPDQPSHWQPITGTWHVAGVSRPQSAADPFKFVGFANSEGVALHTDSYWFWNDYRVSVAARLQSDRAGMGIVYGYRYGYRHGYRDGSRHTSEYFGFTWGGSHSAAREGDRLRLWYRDGNHVEVLAERPAYAKAGQWYRLSVETRGAKIAASVDENLVLTAEDPRLVGGKCGLYVSGPDGAEFDDLLVHATDSSPPLGVERQEPEDMWQGREFAGDPFMIAWGNAQSEWERTAQLGDAWCWYRGYFFGGVRVSLGTSAEDALPVSEVALLTSQDDPNSGYHVSFEAGKVLLRKAGKELPAAQLMRGPLQAKVQGGIVQVAATDRELLRYSDPDPIRKGGVAVRLRSPVSLGTLARALRVTSLSSIDYRFDDAPVDWEVESGQWQATTRWACVPHWSFFGGRGEPIATLWNKRRFAGDQWIEAFMAPREGTSDRIHFAFPINLNVTFCAAGEKLGTGYSLIYRAHDQSTVLYRKGQPVAENKDLVLPNWRADQWTVYYRITQTWQHLEILREGGRIRVWVEIPSPGEGELRRRLLLDYTDPLPLRGDRLALWTWGRNGMAVARARIAAEKVLPPTPSFLSPPCSAAGQSRRRPNPINGGWFCTNLIHKPTAPSDLPLVSFDYRSDKETTLALYAVAGGQRFRADFLGTVTDDGDSIPMGAVHRSKISGNWSRATFPLAHALRVFFPAGELPRVERVSLANLSRRPEDVGGLQVNPKGTVFEWRPVTAKVEPDRRQGSRPPRPIRTLADNAPPAPIVTTALGPDRVDTFETGLGDWQGLGGEQGATLWRDHSTSGSGHCSLRLYHRQLSGTFGAMVRRKPLDARRWPLITFSYEIGSEVQLSLFCEIAGRWYEIGFTDMDHTFPVIGSIANVHADRKWHEAEVDLLSGVQRSGAGTTLVSKLFFADSGLMNNLQDIAWHVDNFRFVPALPTGEPATVKWSAPDSSGIESYSWAFDSQPDTVPDSAERSDATEAAVPMGARYLHVRAVNKRGKRGPVAHFRFVPLPVTQAAKSETVARVNPDVRERIAAPSVSVSLNPLSLRQLAADSVDLETLRLRANAGHGWKEYDLTSRNLRFDAVNATLWWNDPALAENPSPIPSYTLQCELTARDLSGRPAVKEQWQWTVDPSLDRTPPAAPFACYVPCNRLCFEDFEKGLPAEVELRRAAWVLHDTEDAAVGKGCARVVNLEPNDFFAAFLRKNPYAVDRYPQVAFDYRFDQPGCNLNVVSVVNGDLQIVEFAGENGGYEAFMQNSIGRIPNVCQDGRWHHAAFDLGRLLQKRYPTTPRFFADYLGTWAAGRYSSYDNPTGASLWLDNIALFSSNARSAGFVWQPPEEGNGIGGYSYTLDRKQDTVPDERVDTRDTRCQFSDLKPGAWHFHLRACDKVGNWGPASHVSFELAGGEGQAESTKVSRG